MILLNYRLLANLCAFAYMDLPHSILPRIAQGPIPMEEICTALLAQPPCGSLSDFERNVLDSLRRCSLSVISYINHNSTNGFAAYAFSCEEGIILAMRGSESSACVPSLIDWADNFTAPFLGSVQYRDVYRITNRYTAGSLLITGHSKGGHNALYALSEAQNPLARAVVFNAQGFARGQLNDAEIQRLKSHAVNCVTERDIVGALAWHPEKRIFCAAAPGKNPHALESFIWDENGNPVPGRRSVFSRLVELASRLAISGLHNLQSGATIPYQRFFPVSRGSLFNKTTAKQQGETL